MSRCLAYIYGDRIQQGADSFSPQPNSILKTDATNQVKLRLNTTQVIAIVLWPGVSRCLGGDRADRRRRAE